MSKTDFVNSGSYFFTDLVVVFGITTFTGFGGSFFKIGFIVGFTDTRDFAGAIGFFIALCSFAIGLATLCSGFFETPFDAGFLGAGFFMADFGVPFLGAGLGGFPPAARAGFAIAFFDAFFAGLTAPPVCRAGFLVADFPTLCGAGFLVGMLLPSFFYNHFQ
ncbi:MAG TPA: hypothetical protein VFP87_11470 [Chitinophagaceae bacterium]|nr:hypothetical protein [Chitinophagaceae bacterium]